VTARTAVARFAAPAAFLLAATIAILLIRSVLSDDGPAGSGAAPATTSSPATKPKPTTIRAATTPQAAHEAYAIRAGDTLGIVADRYDTTVEALVELNPGIDPTGLQVGQEIRVK
jgi:LysM repeat protein